MMVLRSDTYPSPSLSTGISVFLGWVRMWYYTWAEGRITYDYSDEYYDPRTDYTVNRCRRRFAHKELAPTRYVTLYRSIFARDLTPTQFIERASRLSVMGRRRFYGTLRHWRRHSTRRMEVRGGHGCEEQALFAHIGAINFGLWAAHLWPG